MTNDTCLVNNMLHMIKHDPNVMQIPYRLHSCDQAHSIPHTVYKHFENENLISYNLSWKTTLLNIVITTFGLQCKDVINITTP